LNKEKTYTVAGLALFFVLFSVVAFLKNGTGDAGDSIQHYLISRFAFRHPELFLHHWGKPVFVLLSAPFAQFGFVGIKLFNCLVAVLTGYFTYRIAKQLKIDHPWLAILFLFFAPLYFVYIFSGMTEHLFALALVLSVYLVLKKKVPAAVLIVSFLPFIRSEGLVMAGVFAGYLVLRRNYRMLPFLLTGHVVYSLAGYFYYHDLLWVLNRIPYASLDPWYGSGHPADFIYKLTYVLGTPLYILLTAGLVYLPIAFFIRKNRSSEWFTEEVVLIYGSFLAYFVAHSLFWALGIFNSMGMGRVMIAVVPLTALIGLRGLNLASFSPTNLMRRLIMIAVAGYVILFPFTSNPASVKWDSDLDLTDDQVLIDEITSEVRSVYTGYKYFYSHPYMGIGLGIDPFDRNVHDKIMHLDFPGSLRKHSLVIWDSWFSLVEEQIPADSLLNDKRLLLLRSYESERDPERKIVIFVYE
jgi:hypothetical protein